MPTLPLPIFDAAQFDAQLAADTQPLARYQGALRQGGSAMRAMFAAGSPVRDLVHYRALLLDELLLRIWQHHFPAAADDISLVAVGGYGRAELHPASDVDLMILLQDAAHGYQEQIESFLTFLWDLKLEIGHSVRTVEECIREGREDITVATNLMESRLLCGSRPLFEEMQEATGPRHIWPNIRFFEAKWKEQKRRYQKFGDTAYSLEPNVKEGPGGLRDIQMISWVTRRHFNTSTLHDLVSHGFLTEKEYHVLINGQDYLWRIRYALHTLTGRHEDRLLFDYQRELALQFGYQDGPDNLAVEQFMQSYYRTIMELGRLNDMLLQLFQEAIVYANYPINDRFRSRMGYLEVTRDTVFAEQPLALLETFLILEQHSELKGIRASTIRLIRDHCHLIDDQFRNDPEARRLFMEIIRQPRGLTHELRRMNRYGVLAAYLPAFARIVGRMQYDLFHAYTVDEHSLFVVRNLRRFTVRQFRNEFPLCSRIIDTLANPELLYIAGLFHDIAKGQGGDHSELGAITATDFCTRHGLNSDDTALVAWLVRNHLLMSITAQRKDISDAKVIHEFSLKVGDQMHLDYLYLLTVADMRATNPELWNSWKDALLKELYNATSRMLQQGEERPLDQKQQIRQTQEQARLLLYNQGFSEEQVELVWENPNAEYFLQHTPEEIAWHTGAITHCKPEELPLVLIQPLKQRGSTAIFIYGPAEEHQFAVTTSVLDQLDLTIVDARIIASSNGYTLDTFYILESSGKAVTDPYRLEEIRSTILQQLQHPEKQQRIVPRHVPRKLKHFDIPTRITFEQDEHNARTILRITTADHPGLLSRLGLAFLQCRIKLLVARVTTIGAQAEDIFYITDMDNRMITDHETLEVIEKTILALLEQG